MSGWEVPLSDVRLPPEAIAAARDTLAGGWLSQGPQVEGFEEEFAALAGTRHAVACASGTGALELAIGALELGPGDEVVMPSLTFVAAANAVRLAGALPVFADVRGADDLTLDPDALAGAIGPATRAVIPMDYGGYPCDPEVYAVAAEAGLAVVEDAAHAVGAHNTHGACGSFGDAGCFSFFANKNLPLGEGGMLTTDDDRVAATARSARSHGMTAGTWERRSRTHAAYDVSRPGRNLRLDEPRAAMGRVLLAGLEEANAARRSALERYRRELASVPGLSMPFARRPPGERPAAHLAVVLVDDVRRRDPLADALAQRGVQTSVHYRPVHSFTAYRGAPAVVPKTDDLAARLLTLPLFPHITTAQVDAVCGALATELSA